VLDFQRQMSLRNREVPIVKHREIVPNPSAGKPNKNVALKNLSKSVPEPKYKEKKDENSRHAEKASTSFSLETEITKIKIAVPLSELLKNVDYQSRITKVLSPSRESFIVEDSFNIQDDDPAILFGPHVDKPSGEYAPPFYVSLNIHDTILHNALLDSGASHNLMPKMIMEKLGLEVTRPYKELFSFNSNKVKCLGLIKDLAISLVQISSKSLIMDVVVADIPLKFGMLLSRSWAVKLKGVLQMDMSYATILIFGEQRKLYREQKMAYMVGNAERPINHPIYSLDTKMGSAIFFNEGKEETFSLQNASFVPTQRHLEGPWNVNFYGVVCK